MKKLIVSLTILILGFCLIATPVESTGTISPTKDDEYTAPYNLMAAVIDPTTVMLFWENPVYENQPMGFRIYCNNNMVWQIRDGNATFCTLENVCPGCHEFYVTAYFDSGDESAPSNVYILEVTANEDHAAALKPASLSIYPNPSRSDVTIKLAEGSKSGDTYLSIYNLKGQLVLQKNAVTSSQWQWNGTDQQGNRVPAGMYYIKAQSKTGSAVGKIMLTE
jgi:hypothetical protein